MESEELWMELHVLHQHGWSVSALARHFKLNRRTVRRELDAERPHGYPQRAPRHPFSEAQLAHIERRLLVCPVIRATDLHHELRTEYGYAGSYWTLLRQLRPLRPVIPREPEVRFETLPGVQTQADWKHIGSWPLGEELVELHAMVAILGHSRMPAIRIAASCTREVSFERLVRCLDDLGGVTRELLTDRDTVFCNHIADGPLFVPEWVDLCELLGTVPRACRPYRAKTKGKVERENRELEQSFRCWLTGQVLPPRPAIADYDAFALRWIHERVLPRRHRTTQRIIGEAWAEERRLLTAVPRHPLISTFTSGKSIKEDWGVGNISLETATMAQSGRMPTTRGARLLEFDEAALGAAYRARRSIAIEHGLADQPLLTLSAVADLADWLPRDCVICDTADQPLLVPEGGPPRGSESRPGDVIRHLDVRRSWLTLLNIEKHPDYRALMDACLDEVAAIVERRRGDMRRRVGFIFVSSPRSVTPAHLDIEHTLLLQISGHKELTVGRFSSAAVEQRERERYWEGSHGRVQELPLPDATYDMVPGRGVYIPPIGPHWVRNSDAVTLSMTLTFFSADSEQDQFVEAFNARLRKFGLHPGPPGRSPALDGVKATAMRTWGLRGRLIHRRQTPSHY